MTVFRDKRRNNRWSFEFVLGGIRYQGACDLPDGVNGVRPARTKPEATDAESAVRKRARAEQGMRKSGIRPGGYLLAQALLRHIGNQVDSSKSHVASLNRIAGEMLAYFRPGRAVVDLNADDVDGYRKFLVAQKKKVWIGGPRKQRPEDFGNARLWKVLDRPRSASEVDHCLDCLRSALQAAHTVRDPLTGESMLPFPPEVNGVHVPERDPTPMPERELTDRLAVAPPWVVDGATVARFFGLRLTETPTLELKHLDHEERCIRFKGEETKSGNDQRMYGGDEGWAALLQLAAQARRRGQTRLVTWPGLKWAKRIDKGETPPDDAPWRPLKTIRRSWRTSAARAAVEHPHRFHDLRAGYITGVARLNSSTLTKTLARHASMATTERYIAVAREDLSRAANQAAKRRLKVVK